MNNPPSVLKKIYFPISILLILLLGGLTYKLHSEKDQFSKSLENTRSEVDLLNGKIDFLNKKSFADELFIAGAHDSALAEYHKIFSEEDEAGFFRKRSELKKQIEEEKLEIKRKELAKINEFSKLEQNLEMQLVLAEEKHKMINDSLKNTLRNQISKLNQKLNQKEEELKSVPVSQKISFTNAKGSKIQYVGEVKNGRANGKGVGLWSTGSIYDGEWRDNLRHGKGKYEWPDGERYEGEFAFGKRNGQGTYFWTNGDRYEGNWRDERRNGFGIVYDKDNNIKLKGEWKDDELVKPAKEGN